MPRDERRVELQGVVDAEVGELRPDPCLVDDAVSAVATRQRNVRLEPGLDELRIRRSPPEPGEHADVPALDKAEAAGATGDLGELPRQQVAPLLAVELRRLRKEERLAGKVDAVTKDVRSDAHVRLAREEAIDLLPPRRERHRAVEDGDAALVQAVDLACEREHRPARESHDDGSLRQRAKRLRADELERQLAVEDLQLAVRERAVDERERVERTEQEDLPVVAREEEARPRRPALGVVGPLHLVQDEKLARLGRHLHRRAENGRALVQALLARDEPDLLGAQPLAESSMRLLREHPQRSRVDPRTPFGELAERGVRLTGVRRAEVGDDALRLGSPSRKRHGNATLGLLHLLSRAAPCANGAARPLLSPPRWSACAHRRTVSGRAYLASVGSVRRAGSGGA